MLDRLKKIVQEVSAAPDMEAVLDLIVRRIQQSIGSEVCSVFLRDTVTERYVLRASQGLNAESVGKVALSASEGLVGRVASRAEPINLENAETHEAFRYFHETGEERYHAFLGVPVMHHGKVLGVLVVQQQASRCFDESEEAFLVTISAQLAGVIAHAQATGAVKDRTGQQGGERRFQGVAGATGVAIGRIKVVTPLVDLDTVPDRLIEDTAYEVARFERALIQVRADIEQVGARLAQHLRPEEQALFDVYLRMLEDNTLLNEVVSLIRQGSWAQGALRQVVNRSATQFDSMDDPYLKERASDVRDMGRRLLACLQEGAGVQPIDLSEGAVLVTNELSATVLGEVGAEKLAGLISVQGSGNSHAAILARSMGIPTVLGLVDLPIQRIDGLNVILDGFSGCVYIDPSEKLLDTYRAILQEQDRVAEELAELKNLPAVTQDGQQMPLWVNTGLVADVERSLALGAEGIGLYRTEIPFMVRDFFPSEQEQTQIYRRQLEAFAPRPVTMRTLDIGGDKALPYFPIQEDNPFLGWRGIRVTLDHPDIFLVQIRAMLRASEGLDNLRIMLPMVTGMQEVHEAQRLLNRAHAELQEEGVLVALPPLGIMVEVPAAVYQVRRFAQEVDFISVGSNDLIQYLLAVDRNNPRVAGLYMAYHPAVLRALEFIVREAHKEKVPVSICGEVAAEPGGALLLMAMGYDVLSMSATSLPRIKSAVRSVSAVQARTLYRQVMRMDDAQEIALCLRETLQAWGLGHLSGPVLPN